MVVDGGEGVFRIGKIVSSKKKNTGALPKNRIIIKHRHTHSVDTRLLCFGGGGGDGDATPIVVLFTRFFFWRIFFFLLLFLVVLECRFWRWWWWCIEKTTRNTVWSRLIEEKAYRHRIYKDTQTDTRTAYKTKLTLARSLSLCLSHTVSFSLLPSLSLSLFRPPQPKTITKMYNNNAFQWRH